MNLYYKLFNVVFGFSWNQYQTDSKRRKNFGLILSRSEETLEGSGEVLKSHEGVRSSEARSPSSWASGGTSWPNSTSINSQIFYWHQRAAWNTFFAAASLFSHEIPSGGLLRYSTRGGIDHGGDLHQPCCPSNDVWVVYLRPTGP